MNNFFDNADIIYSYSRQQAISDGILVDVSDIAQEVGFRKHWYNYPVALTNTVFAQIGNIPKSRNGIESIHGRIWNVLWMAKQQIFKNPPTSVDTDRLFDVILSQPRCSKKRFTFKVSAGYGDEGEMTFTIMLPNES